jgi:hypothetical protein
LAAVLVVIFTVWAMRRRRADAAGEMPPTP